ncbi:MAG TPA: MAPEG family protein [Xanthobacteraceae bacterium]
MHSPLLPPIVALVLWSLVMCAWLYATRIPAMKKLKVVYDPHLPAEAFHEQLPAEVRWKADNYNNLMEQPTLFYTIALALALLPADAGLNAGLAWLYVALRVAHSLVQATINVVILRFSLFMAATLVLLAMAIRATLAML